MRRLCESEVLPGGELPCASPPIVLNCLCFVTPVNIPYNEFENALVGGQYDQYLNGIMGEDFAAQLGGAQGISMPAPPSEIVFYQPNIKQSISAASTPEEIAKIMQGKYPNIQFADFNRTNTTVEAAKQYAKALDEMLQKYPNNNLDVVSFGVNPEIEYGRTYTSPNGRSAIVFNKRYSLDPDYTYQKMGYDVSTGFHVQRSEEDPYYANALHEFGHVLDGYSRYKSQYPILDDLTTNWMNSKPTTLTSDEFLKWAHQYMVDYCFSEKGSINMIEAIGEAFADVELNGKEASITSQIIYNNLMDSVKAA